MKAKSPRTADVIAPALTLYGTVGEDFTAEQVRAWIDEHGADDHLTVNLNSGGGYAFEGLAIYNVIKAAYIGKVTINIDAVAASAASLIAMAGDDIVMRDGAMMMIHDPSAATIGTASDHRKSATTLEQFSEQFRRIYATRSGRSDQEVAALMATETWMNADQAIQLGFATRKSDDAAMTVTAFDYGLYRKAPTFLMQHKGSKQMPKPASDTDTDEKPWIGKFLKSALGSGLEMAQLNDIVASSTTMESAKDALVDAMAAMANADKPGANGGHVTLDNPNVLDKAIEDAIYCRMTGKSAEGPAKEFVGRSLIDMGAALLQARGQRVSWASRERLASQILMDRGPSFPAGAPFRMAGGGGQHTTSDFPVLTSLAGQRVMLEAYKAAECPLKLFAKRRDATDFRALSAVHLGEAPELNEVPESGEVKYGTRAEAKESFRVKTYARIFGLSRQALVNDDLGAFADTTVAWGRAAAETEAAQLVALFTANGGDGVSLDDTAALYTTGRGNKAGSGGAISVTTLGAARQAMREVKGLDGKTPISVTPKHLLVGAAKETEAEQILAVLAAAQVAETNPFSGKLTLHVEARLTGNAWRLFADPSQMATIVIAYLNGVTGPIMDVQQGWTTLGAEFRAILDFGCGVTDWRGTYLNSGN